MKYIIEIFLYRVFFVYTTAMNKIKKFLVGGAVRDQIMGLAVKDRDWVVVGSTPQDMLDHGFSQVGNDFPVFLHPETGEEHALARKERSTGDGYEAFEFDTDPTVTLEEDLRRRDSTMNSIAMDDDGTLIDPFGGLDDIKNRIIRHTSDAFAEDPVRILRVARFMARYSHMGFHIAPETSNLMIGMCESGAIDSLVKERVWQELDGALGEQDPFKFFQTLSTIGALDKISPTIGIAMKREFHNITSLNAQCNGLANHVRLALLLNDGGDIEKLKTELSMPNEFVDILSTLERTLGDILNIHNLNADQIIALAKSLDFRRNKRKVADIIDIIRITRTKTSELEFLKVVIDQLLSIDEELVARESNHKSDIGKNIHCARVMVIEDIIEINRVLKNRNT